MIATTLAGERIKGFNTSVVVILVDVCLMLIDRLVFGQFWSWREIREEFNGRALRCLLD